MKHARNSTLIALCFLTALCFAQTETIVWKLNEAKSKIPQTAVKSKVVTYAILGGEGGTARVTVEGEADGKPMRNEWMGKFDGKDYPLTGDSSADSRSYQKIGEHEMELTNKKDGKVVMTARLVVSKDGKTRTVTAHGTNDKGEKFEYTAIYDRE